MLNLPNRENDPKEIKHLKNPAFLERFFHKKAVWVTTVAILTPFMLWGVVIATLDILGVKDEKELDIFTDIIILFGVVVGTPLVINEYHFYQKMIWSKKKRNIKK